VAVHYTTKEEREKLVADISAIPLYGDKDYGWVWEYARFRFATSASNVRTAEEKAGWLLKLVLSAIAAAWVLFLYLVTQLSLKPSDVLNHWIFLGGAFTASAAASALVGLVPKKRLALFREAVAVRFVNEAQAENAKEPMGRFALGLMKCSDRCDRYTVWKSYCVLLGLVLLAIAISLFTVGFFASLSRSG